MSEVINATNTMAARPGAAVEGELTVGNDQLLMIAEQAEKRVAAVNAIMKAALKMTTYLDWVKIGGTPYLQETGSSKIARLMGVSWQMGNYHKIYDPDNSGHYSYHYEGKFFFAGAEIDAVGMRSTKDEFFIGRAKNPDGTPKPQKKPQDVNERYVKLAAYTNWLNNGIKRIVPGLRNITMETLAEAGIDISKVRGYDFNTSSPVEMSEEGRSQRSEIERMLKEVAASNGKDWLDGLEHLTAWVTKDGREMKGKRDINKISEASLPVVYGKVKKGYDDWKASRGQKSEVRGQAEVSADNEPLPWDVPADGDS